MATYAEIIAAREAKETAMKAARDMQIPSATFALGITHESAALNDAGLLDLSTRRLDLNEQIALRDVLNELHPTGEKPIESSGAALIAAERKRQVSEESWDADHDDGHDNDEIALAAVCYALPQRERGRKWRNGLTGPKLWPWSLEWWKPSRDDRVRELVKAGALIAAEIDRLQRRKAGAAC